MANPKYIGFRVMLYIPFVWRELAAMIVTNVFLLRKNCLKLLIRKNKAILIPDTSLMKRKRLLKEAAFVLLNCFYQ